MFALFADCYDKYGLISKEELTSCLMNLAEPSSRVAAREVAVVVTFLFQTFDTETTGSIDYCKTCTGLLTLGDGSRGSMALDAFRLYDPSSRGAIVRDTSCLIT